MPAGSITSANASFQLTIPGVYSSGVLLQNFDTDNMFTPDPQKLTEARIGADGFTVGGYVFNLTKMSVHFQANSDSIPVFYAWKAAQDAVRDIIVATAKIISPALGLDVDLSDIFIDSLPLLPPHQKVVGALTVDLMIGAGWQTSST